MTAAKVVEHPSWGIILSDYGDGRAIGVPDERKRLMLRTFCELAAPELLDQVTGPTEEV